MPSISFSLAPTWMLANSSAVGSFGGGPAGAGATVGTNGAGGGGAGG